MMFICILVTSPSILDYKLHKGRYLCYNNNSLYLYSFTKHFTCAVSFDWGMRDRKESGWKAGLEQVRNEFESHPWNALIEWFWASHFVSLSVPGDPLRLQVAKEILIFLSRGSSLCQWSHVPIPWSHSDWIREMVQISPSSSYRQKKIIGFQSRRTGSFPLHTPRNSQKVIPDKGLLSFYLSVSKKTESTIS